MKRGDVVGIDFPFSDGSGSKLRPSLVIQADHRKGPDVILAMISGTSSDASVPLPVDPQTGLRKPCFVRCDKLYSVERTKLYGSLGRLSSTTMKQVDESLKTILGLT